MVSGHEVMSLCGDTQGVLGDPEAANVQDLVGKARILSWRRALEPMGQHGNMVFPPASRLPWRAAASIPRVRGH